jgi:thymidylate kinase
MGKQKEIAIIGIDGSGKDKQAEILSMGGKATVIRLTNYDPKHKVFRTLAKLPNKLISEGEKKRSKKLAVAGYAGHSLLFGPYHLIKKWEKDSSGRPREKVIYVRHPVFDAEALAAVYGKGKVESIIKNLAKFVSISKKPDEIYLMEVPARIAMERIRQRGKGIQIHENEKSLAKMAQVYSRMANEAKKKGIKVYRKRM